MLDRNAVEEYLEQNQTELIESLSRGKRIPEELVMDIYQTTVAEMLTHHEDVKSPRNLFGTIARRKMIQILRMQNGRGAERRFVHEDALDSYITPSGIDTMAQLEQALSLLSERQRDYVEKVYLEECSDAELAAAFPTSNPTSVKSMARRAIIKLRELV